jgi:hypothetical protein
MTDIEHQTLIDEALRFVRSQIAQGGLEFTLLTIDEQGRRGRFNVDPRFVQSDGTKDVLAAELRQALREDGIVRYVLVAECWMDRRLPVTPGPLRRDHLAEVLARYAKDYERRGLSPDHGGGRDEIIFMHVCDRRHSTFRIWTIERDPITGAVQDLLPFDAGADALAGRFVNLLGGEAN